MDLKTALKGMADAQSMLRSKEGVKSLPNMSENMDRLAAYTSAVEDHLADLEEQLQIAESEYYYDAKTVFNMTPAAAEREAKYASADLKGNIKRLTRLVNSAWKLISVKQSRFNHLVKEQEGQI